MRALPPGLEKQPCVIESGPDRERPMLDALLVVLRTFTMVDHANPRVVPVAELDAAEKSWYSESRWALVLDGWVRRHDNTELVLGTLGQVRLAAEFFAKAWRLRDAQEKTVADAAHAVQLEEFVAQRVIRLRRPPDEPADGRDARNCYIRKGAQGRWIQRNVERARATVFRDKAQAEEFAQKTLSPLAGQLEGFYKDEPWDDFFVVVPADEVPGSWRLGYPWA